MSLPHLGRLFAPGETAAVAQRRIAQQSSVLDFGAKDLARVRSNLGKDERDKLDVHASAIRDYERRVSLIASRPRAGRCAAPPDGNNDVVTAQLVQIERCHAEPGRTSSRPDSTAWTTSRSRSSEAACSRA